MANPTASIITASSFVFLYIGKDKLNVYVRQRLPAPIPFELLLIITTTAISAIFQLHERGKITIAKEIPVGLPIPKIPRFDLMPYVLGDALEIAFVVVALHLSMCRLFNRRMGTKTNNNQELYAMGFMSTLSSVFTTYPVTSGRFNFRQ
jgi:MFS superfamily sulfate permease-like transporter